MKLVVQFCTSTNGSTSRQGTTVKPPLFLSVVMAERTVAKAKLYATLHNAYVAAYPKKSKQVCQQEFNVKWTGLKKGEGLEDKVVALLWELKSVELKTRIPADFLVKQTAVAPLSAALPNVSSVCPFTSSAVSDDVKVASDNPSLTPTITTPVLVTAKVQEALKNESSLINSDLVGLLKRKSLGLLTDSQDDLKAKN